MDPQLIGLWSANEYEGTPSGPAEEELIFKPDGTGRLEIINYFPVSVEFFHWAVTSAGYISLIGFKSVSVNGEGDVVEEPSLFQFENVPYQIQEQLPPPLPDDLVQLQKALASIQVQFFEVSPLENSPNPIEKHAAPSHGKIQVLTLSLPPRDERLYKDYVPEQYGLLRRDLTGLKEPNFSPWKS